MVDIALNEHFIPIFVNTSPDPSFHSSESFYLLCGCDDAWNFFASVSSSQEEKVLTIVVELA